MKKLPCALWFVLSAAAAMAAPISVGYAPPTQMAQLGTTFVAWDSLTPKNTAVGLYRQVFDAPTATLEKLEVHVTTLNPGKISHPPHHHPWEEMLLILDGKVEASINGQKYPGGPGSLIFFASHDVHNLANVGDTPATYYVINFVTDAVHAVLDEPAAARPLPDKLASAVIDSDHLPATPTKTGARCKVVDSATRTFLRLECHITTLNAGEGTLPNIRDNGDEFFIVRTGVIEAKCNGVTCRLKAGSCFYFAPNEGRAFKNIGTTPASYQVFKVVSAQSPAEIKT
jgi:quercetin dioxygenase-like cupin family protein